MNNSKLLIVSATGKQGHAVIESLIAQSAQFDILALTSNADTPRAQHLSSQANITVVVGASTVAALDTIFEAHKPIHGVLCVTASHGHGPEEGQAKPLIDVAIKNGVNHFVFSSVDRGGDISDGNATTVPHFAAKHNIELYLKEQIKMTNSTMQYTILRPTAFMENLTNDFMGKTFATMWRALGKTPLQLISVRDIGVLGARAFMNLDTFKGRAISMAGDEMTFEQAQAVFEETVGYAMPETYALVGSLLQWAIGEVGKMFRWFKTDGYGADISNLRKAEPELQDFRTWLKETSDFRKR